MNNRLIELKFWFQRIASFNLISNIVSGKNILLEERISELEKELTGVRNAYHESTRYFLNLRVGQILDTLRLNTVMGLNLKRFGSLGDGGYIMLDDLSDSDFLISAGIGDNISFENALSKYVSGGVAVDHTVPGFQSPTANFRIVLKKLTAVPEDNSVTLRQLIQDSPSYDYILKLDIEGDEWVVLDTLLSADLKKFRQIIIEFHWLHSISDFAQFQLIYSVLRRLNLSHAIISASANNWGACGIVGGYELPDVIEVTYARRSSYSFETTQMVNFEALQFKNNPNGPDLSNEWLFQ